MSEPGHPMLKLEDLSCGYGAVTAVGGLTLEVSPGELFALLGPNGAGKTSTLMAIMGHVQVTAGAIRFDGQDITALPATARAALGVALVPEGRRLFGDMSVMENLVVGGYSKPKVMQERNLERAFALFPLLKQRQHQLAASLSGGEQQMLAIGRALMAEPRLLLVDELSLGLMPKAVGLFIDILRTLRKQGVTVILVEQNTQRALQLADRVCVLVAGRSVFQGTAAAVREDASIFSRYLGVKDPTSADGPD